MYLEIAGPPPTTAVLGRGHGRVGHRRAILAYPASLISDARACASCLTSAFLVLVDLALAVETPIASLFPLCIRIVHPFISHHRAAFFPSPPSASSIKHRQRPQSFDLRYRPKLKSSLTLCQSESCGVNTIIHTTKTKKQTNDA